MVLELCLTLAETAFDSILSESKALLAHLCAMTDFTLVLGEEAK